MIQNYKKLLKDNFAKQIAKTFIDITTSSMSAFLDSSKDKISLYIIDDNTTEFKNFCCYDEKTSTYEIFITKPNYTTIKNIFMFDKTIEVNGKKITPLDDMESTYLLISKQILMHEFNHIKISNVKNLSQINKKLKQDGINPIWLNIFEDVRVNTFNDKLPKYKYVLNQLIKIDKSYFAENASKEEIMFSICISLNKYKAYEYANTTHYDYCVDIFNKIKNAKTISQTIDLLYEFFKKNINNKLNNSENMNKNNSNEDNTNNNMTNNKDNSYFDDNFDEDNTDNMTNNKDNSYFDDNFDEDDISKMNNNYFEQMSEDICEETIEKIKQTSIKIDDELIQKIKNIHANIDSENVIYAKPIKKTFTYNANNNYDTLLPTEYSCFEDETQKKLYSHTVKHLKNFFTNGFKQSSKQTNKLNMEKLHTLPYNKTLTNMFLTKEKNIADIKQTFFIDCSGSMTGLPINCAKRMLSNLKRLENKIPMKTLIILHTSQQATAFWLKDTNCLELLNLDTFSSGEGLFQAIDLALKKFRNHLIVSKQILFFTDADITDNNEECRKKIQTIPNENINGFHLGNRNVELMPKFFKKFFSIKLDDTDDYLSYLLKANEIIINSLTEENQQKVIKKIRSDKKITTHKNYLKI